MKRIMIIDDDREFLEEINEMLKASGYNTILLSDSKKAVDKVCEYKPDVLLLDIKMEGASGFKIADELRRIPEAKSIPFIGVTGFYTEDEHKLFMKMCGIKTVIIKPFRPLDIIVAIERAIGGDLR